MEKKSFTLTEVIVGTVILALVFGGLLAAFTAARRYVTRANRRLVAANLTRSVLERLYKEVREDTWDDADSPLSVGDHTLSDTNPAVDTAAITDIDAMSYSGEYTVNSVSSEEYREVVVTVTAAAL